MQQEYNLYKPEDFAVWSLLFSRQMENLSTMADPAFLSGLERIHFTAERIPDFKVVNSALENITGWHVQAVPGIVPDAYFFELLSQKRFPATTWLRTMAQLDYLEEPDMFHDVFGHIPLLTDTDYCNFLHGLSLLALQHLSNPYAVELLSRVYWYTIEFGLIDSGEGPRIYGAGILSSKGETPYSLSKEVPKKPFSVPEIMRTGYIKEKFQEVYFVIADYAQLYGSLPLIAAELESMLAESTLPENNKGL